MQHAEPDHSGSIKEFVTLYPDTEIVCTAKCADMLSKMKDMTVVEPVVTLRSRLHTSNLESIQSLARSLAQAR